LRPGTPRTRPAILIDEATAAIEPADVDLLEQTLFALDLKTYELAGQRATNVIALNRQRAEAQALLEQQGQQHRA